jgi:hypothetical protein
MCCWQVVDGFKRHSFSEVWNCDGRHDLVLDGLFPLVEIVRNAGQIDRDRLDGQTGCRWI